MKKALIHLSFLLLCHSIFAQNEVDALRYSFLQPSGTARYVGLGGAMGALGADISTLSQNPAGIGLFTKSEFSFTPAIFTSVAQSSYLGENNYDYKVKMNIDNVGFVYTEPTAYKNWKFLHFGFGINKLANFNNRVLINAFNPTYSIMNDYYDNAQGLTPDELNEFNTGLAYDTYLLDDTTGAGYINAAFPFNGGVEQQLIINRSGHMNEIAFTFGGNYNDKLYLGATLGIPYVNFYETQTYQESTTDETAHAGFNSLKIKDELTVKGTGTNLKMGAIYRVADYLRVGAGFTTPTLLVLNEEFHRTFSSSFYYEPYADVGTTFSAETPENTLSYSIYTPFRANGSMAIILGTKGLISADYEYVNYSNALLQSFDYNYKQENAAIKANYKGAHNLKIGTEINLSPLLLRGGYAFYDSPYQNTTQGRVHAASVGFGFRGKHAYFDMSYVRTLTTETHTLYNSDYIPTATSDIGKNQLLFTIGFRN